MPERTCQFCGAGVEVPEPVGRDATCAGCGRDLRCCRQCRHYDPRCHNDCRETDADPVTDKERRNFCEYFVFSRAAAVGDAGGAARAAAARQRLDSLFAGPAPGAAPAPGKSAREKLDELFRRDPGGE